MLHPIIIIPVYYINRSLVLESTPRSRLWRTTMIEGGTNK